MKIGVIGSGFDVLPLFQIFSRYDIGFEVYLDLDNRSLGDKDFEYSLSCVSAGVEFLKSKGVDFVIVPPVYELSLLGKYDFIMPLFKDYLIEKCLGESLVGKIGFVGDYADLQVIDGLFKQYSGKYILSNNQKNIKKFNFPFAIWSKEVILWKYYLMKFGFRDWMVRKTIKNDIRYFKDAGVDTLVPLNYGYICYETIIDSKINQKKLKFHGKDALDDVFSKLISGKTAPDDKYSVQISYKGNIDLIKREKKWIIMMNRGNKIDLIINRI